MKYTQKEYLDGDCTWKQYAAQFNPIKLELYKIYLQESASWAKKHFKIIFTDDKIAVGISVYNQISNKYIGEYCIFDVNSGFKYDDKLRYNYRLICEIKK